MQIKPLLACVAGAKRGGGGGKAGKSVYLLLIHARIHANKLLIIAQPIRNLQTPASVEMNKRGFL